MNQIQRINLPFDTNQMNDNEKLTIMTDQLFDQNISPFVENVFIVLAKSLT